MVDPVGDWADIERKERTTILREFDEEARGMALLPAADRSVLETLRMPLELAFALVFGVICGLISVLGVIVLRIFLG